MNLTAPDISLDDLRRGALHHGEAIFRIKGSATIVGDRPDLVPLEDAEILVNMDVLVTDVHGRIQPGALVTMEHSQSAPVAPEAEANDNGIARLLLSYPLQGQPPIRATKENRSGTRLLNMGVIPKELQVVIRQTEPQNDTIVILDSQQRKVYKYSLEGLFLGSFELAPQNFYPVGIATDGSYVWVGDNLTRDYPPFEATIFVYSLAGKLAGTFSIGIPTPGARISGMGADGESLWIALNSWAMNLSHLMMLPSLDPKIQGGFEEETTIVDISSYNSASLTVIPWTPNAVDMASDGRHLWALDPAMGRVGVFQIIPAQPGGSLGLSLRQNQWGLARQNQRAGGITVGQEHLWLVDVGSLKVFRYDLQGKPVAEFDLHPSNNSPIGIAM